MNLNITKAMQQLVMSFMAILDEEYNVCVIVQDKETKGLNVAGNSHIKTDTIELLHKAIKHIEKGEQLKSTSPN